MDANGVVAEAPFRLLGHLDLGGQPAHRWIPSSKLNAGCFTDQTPSPVAPDEIIRPQRLAIRQLNIDAGVVLRKTRHFTSPSDRHRQLADPFGQDALDVVLPQRAHVVVPAGTVADIQRDVETYGRMQLSSRDEPSRDSSLIENLDGARVEASSTRSDEVLVDASLQDENVDTRQGQLARQHQSRRTSSGNHYCMLLRRHSRDLLEYGSGIGGRCCTTVRALPQASGALYSESARKRVPRTASPRLKA